MLLATDAVVSKVAIIIPTINVIIGLGLKRWVCKSIVDAGADPEIFKREGTLCLAPWLAGEENFRFQMV